jgi:Raf kinase inhibitor-like YbhB/YbcL family protein
MKRVLAITGLIALVGVSACRHDGRDLAPETPNGTQSIKPATTVPTDDTADDGGVAIDGSVDDGDDVESVEGEEGDLDEEGNPQVSESFAMQVVLPFAADSLIDPRYTCDGLDVAPEVLWSNLPEGTVEVAIDVTDLQADNYTHWVIAGLDPDAGGLDEGDVPTDAIQATNSKGEIGYTGPCPPPGERHVYLFRVSALGEPIDLANGADAATLIQAIDEVTIESASESGSYNR